MFNEVYQTFSLYILKQNATLTNTKPLKATCSSCLQTLQVTRCMLQKKLKPFTYEHFQNLLFNYSHKTSKAPTMHSILQNMLKLINFVLHSYLCILKLKTLIIHLNVTLHHLTHAPIFVFIVP